MFENLTILIYMYICILVIGFFLFGNFIRNLILFSLENSNRMQCVCAGVCVCVCIERVIYFKELAYVIVEAGRSKLLRKGWQAGDPGSG